MKNVGIIGVSGYTGFELVKLILNHPGLKITYLAASKESKIDEIFPSLKGVFEFDVEVADAKMAAQKCDLIFLALPHKTAMEFAKEILKHDAKVVDLSADYRLNLANYEKNYTAHLDKENLKNAVYGLVEINRNFIKKATLVANPGCYPTATLLAAIPFINYLEPNIFVDAKSGVSGAGKNLKQSSHFISANENINAYSPFTHRHSDEIKEKLENFAKTKINLAFVPHLIPITRGMLVSVFGVLKEKIDAFEVLKEFYKNDEFIRVRNAPVSVKDCVGTHFCDIYLKVVENQIWINSSIDNLLRGASSQALANANLMLGFDENVGLPKLGSGI